MPPSRSGLAQQRANLSLLVGVAALGCLLGAALVFAEFRGEPQPTNWWAFGVTSLLLVLCELSPRMWIRIEGGTTLTPLPSFAYALLLLGSPAGALGATLVGSLVYGWTGETRWWARLLHFGRTLVVVSAAGLVLFAMRARGSVTQFDRIPWKWSVSIILVGLTILVLDTVVSQVAIAVRRGVGFVPLLRRGLTMRFTAVGSLLSLAPIWVIGINSGFVLLPLLTVTTVLVFASTRRALERAHEARHDPLTGLANRRSLALEIEDACDGVGSPARGALLLLDLDGFKDVNDRLGHDVGDAVLVAFAERLTESLPTNAYAARLGGDEFGVLITWLRADPRIDEVIAGLHAQLEEPLAIQGFPLAVGVSIGVARIPEDGRTGERLLQAADVAMYRSKRQGTSVEVFHEDVQAAQVGTLGLLSDLGAAIRDNELRVDYQPQLSMVDGRVVTVEALVRWQHPVHGTIPPNDFIGLAEQTELIGPITDIVLRMATNGLLLLGEDDVRLSVNASVRNLQDPDFAASTLAVLREVGFPAERLELEVTERALVTRPERTSATVNTLRQAGVHITVDGFGTGYASYQTLRALSVDRVKIDREFILRLLQDDDDRVIVASVVALAHALGLEAVAEGVEANETWDVLAAMGCDAAQGYGIAMPMSLTALRSWMSQWHRAARAISES
jgi:diguanylate cyclase (GGDEF)-like protein